MPLDLDYTGSKRATPPPSMKRIVRSLSLAAVILAASLSSPPSARAQGVAQTNVVAIADNTQATVNYVVPIGLTIAGLLIAWAIGKRVFVRVAR